MISRPVLGFVAVVAVAAMVGACTGAIVSSAAGWVIGPLIAVTMLPVVMRSGGEEDDDARTGLAARDDEPEWAADRPDDSPRPGDWDGPSGDLDRSS